MNLRVYLAIILNKTHTFIPNHETTWQLLNPFRILLKLTYTPLRLGLFFGHLISIGAVSDRVPGIPEILSAILGIVAEFFEDWHYFFSLEHAHKEDIGSLLDEQGESGGHNHDDDIPTKALRALFSPLIYLAAWWDSAASDRKEYRHKNLDHSPLEKTPDYATFAPQFVKGCQLTAHTHLNSSTDIQTKTPAIATLFDAFGERPELSFERAFERNQGIKPAVAVQLEVDDLEYLACAQYVPEAELPNAQGTTSTPIATPVHSDATPRLIKNLASMSGQRTSEAKNLMMFSLFKRGACCDAPHLNQHILEPLQM